MPNIYEARKRLQTAMQTPSGPYTEALFSTITEEYAKAYRAIQARADAIAKKIEQASASGEGYGPAEAYKDERYRALLGVAGSELSRFAARASDATRKGQRRAIGEAEQDAVHYVRMGEGIGAANAFLTINPKVAEAFIGLAGDGSPLLQVFGEMVPDGVSAVRTAITTSLLLGENPVKLAARLQKELGAPLVRAQTVARTEVLRAYRESSLSMYQDNADVVKGWIWHANLTVRTCAYCIARHGSKHALDEHMATHPSCRCAMIPLTRSWEELGLGRDPAFESGSRAGGAENGGDVWFHQQPPDVQRAILGKGKYDLYAKGALNLRDLIGTRDDPRWGVVGYERTLAEVAQGIPGPPVIKRGAAGKAKGGADLVALQKEAAEARAEIGRIDEKYRLKRADLEARIREADEAYQAMYAKQREELAAVYRGDTLTAPYGSDEWLKQKAEQKGVFDAMAERHKQELEPAYAKLKALRSELRVGTRDAQRAENHAVLAVKTPATMPDAKYLQNYRGDVKPSVQKGIDAFASFVGAPVDPSKFLGVEIKGATFRAHFDNHGSIVLARGEGVGVIVHELGHWLEWADPEAARKAQAFLDRRTAGQQETTIYRGTSERGIKDNFINHYMGKIYKSARGTYATEITSMGLQMFYEEAEHLARDDPDYFDFIYRMVRGGE